MPTTALQQRIYQRRPKKTPERKHARPGTRDSRVNRFGQRLGPTPGKTPYAVNLIERPEGNVESDYHYYADDRLVSPEYPTSPNVRKPLEMLFGQPNALKTGMANGMFGQRMAQSGGLLQALRGIRKNPSTSDSAGTYFGVGDTPYERLATMQTSTPRTSSAQANALNNIRSRYADPRLGHTPMGQMATALSPEDQSAIAAREGQLNSSMPMGGSALFKRFSQPAPQVHPDFQADEDGITPMNRKYGRTVNGRYIPADIVNQGSTRASRQAVRDEIVERARAAGGQYVPPGNMIGTHGLMPTRGESIVQATPNGGVRLVGPRQTMGDTEYAALRDANWKDQLARTQFSRMRTGGGLREGEEQLASNPVAPDNLPQWQQARLDEGRERLQEPAQTAFQQKLALAQAENPPRFPGAEQMQGQQQNELLGRVLGNPAAVEALGADGIRQLLQQAGIGLQQQPQPGQVPAIEDPNLPDILNTVTGAAEERGASAEEVDAALKQQGYDAAKLTELMEQITAKGLNATADELAQLQMLEEHFARLEREQAEKDMWRGMRERNAFPRF